VIKFKSAQVKDKEEIKEIIVNIEQTEIDIADEVGILLDDICVAFFNPEQMGLSLMALSEDSVKELESKGIKIDRSRIPHKYIKCYY
jgi:hypothetical protein